MRVCIRMRPATRSWRRWPRRQLRERLPENPDCGEPTDSTFVGQAAFALSFHVMEKHMKSSRYLRILSSPSSWSPLPPLPQQQPAASLPAFPPPASPGSMNTGPRALRCSPTIIGQLARYRDANAALKAPGQGRTASYFSATPSPTSGISTNTFPASLTSIAALEGRPRRRCWCASGRM